VRTLDFAYAAAPSRANLLSPALRDALKAAVAVVVSDEPAVKMTPASADAAHSGFFTSLTSSALPYSNFGSPANADELAISMMASANKLVLDISTPCVE